VRLRRQVVDLVRLDLLHDAGQVGTVGQVTVVQHEALVSGVRVLVDVIDALGVEQRSAALDAVDLVAFLEQQFSEVRAVLAGDAGDECLFQYAGLLVQGPDFTTNEKGMVQILSAR
jgi:hypothetical protein